MSSTKPRLKIQTIFINKTKHNKISNTNLVFQIYKIQTNNVKSDINFYLTLYYLFTFVFLHRIFSYWWRGDINHTIAPTYKTCHANVCWHLSVVSVLFYTKSGTKGAIY